jgi:hypothetical protein
MKKTAHAAGTRPALAGRFAERRLKHPSRIPTPFAALQPAA